MADFYDNLAATATRLLNRYGRAMQVKRTIPGTYDPVTGTETGASTIYAATVGVFTKITTDYALAHEVQSGDRMLILDASVAPELTDKLVVGASALTIVNIEAINPAGTPLAYRLQVRGAVADSDWLIGNADGGDVDGSSMQGNLDGGNAASTGTGSISGGGA
jgi:hypothetical protein